MAAFWIAPPIIQLFDHPLKRRSPNVSLTSHIHSLIHSLIQAHSHFPIQAKPCTLTNALTQPQSHEHTFLYSFMLVHSVIYPLFSLTSLLTHSSNNSPVLIHTFTHLSFILSHSFANQTIHLCSSIHSPLSSSLAGSPGMQYCELWSGDTLLSPSQTSVYAGKPGCDCCM